MADTREIRIGQLAVKKGLITGTQLADILKAQEDLRAATGKTRQIGDLLVERGLVEKSKLQELLQNQIRRGTRELGGFELISRLGAGGMGAVYKAKQKSMDRLVALKVLPPRLAKDQSFIERFFREARSVAKLNHQNIVQGIDVGEASGYYYLAMEFVQGSSLRDIIQKCGPMSEKESIEVIEQVAKALKHAHAHDLIHRDVKPDNVLIDTQGVAKLCDLGLARQAQDDSSLTQTGVALGTPHYIAPEQARGEDVDGRADLYSLGATWFHMLAGRPPYVADNALAVITKHLTEPPPLLSSACSGASPGIEAVILKLMAKEPSDRYMSAGELLEDIADLRAGRSPRLAAGAAAGRAAARTMPLRKRDTRKHSAISERTMPDLPDGVHLGPPRTRHAPPGPLSRRPVQLAMAAGLLVAIVLGTWAVKRAVVGSPPAAPEPGPQAPPDHPGPQPGPGPGPGPTTSPGRLAELEDMYQHILKTEKDHPDDLQLLEERWGTLRDAGKSTKYFMIAQDRLKAVAARRKALALEELEGRKRRLDEFIAGVKRRVAAGEFGPAVEEMRSVPPELVRVPGGAARIKAVERQARAAAARAIADCTAAARRLYEKNDFEAARRELEKLPAMGMPEAEDAHRQETAALESAERRVAGEREREARAKFQRALAGLEKIVKRRDFKAALKQLDSAAEGLQPELVEQLAQPRREMLKAAEDFMQSCRKRAAAPPAGYRIKVQGMSFRVTAFDAENDVISIERGTTIKSAMRLAQLRSEQLLSLAGMTKPDGLPAGDARSAGCFLLLSGENREAGPYIHRAREGRALSPPLERAIAVLERGEAEVAAEEKFGALENAFKEKRWPECLALGDELLRESAATEFLKPRLGIVRKMLDEARFQVRPAETHTVVLQDGAAAPDLGIVRYRGASDTFLSRINIAGTVVHGREEVMKTYSGGMQVPLLRFDLSALPREAKIEKAVLELYCVSCSYGFVPGESKVSAYALTRSWQEYSATFINRSKTDPGGEVRWTKPGAQADRDTVTNWGMGAGGKVAECAPNPRDWARLDVTRLAAAWHSGAKANFGLMIRPEFRGLVSFLSRENRDRELRPRLVLTFRSKPLRKALPFELDPREAKVYGLGSAGEAEKFTREFAFSRYARRPDAARTPVALGRGHLAVDISPGDVMVASSRTHRFGKECSVSFRIDCSEKRIKNRGHAAFGFPMTGGQGLNDRLGVCAVLVCTRNELISAMVKNIAVGPRRERIVEGKPIQAGEALLEPWNARLSWKSPCVAWFLNGKRVAVGKLKENDARRIADSAVAIYWGMYPSRDTDDKVNVKVSRVAVGLPHEKDFEGAETLPEPGREDDPPEPRPRPPGPGDGGRRPPRPRP